MTDTFDERKEALLHRYDTELLIEALQISADDLLEAFEQQLIEYFEKQDMLDEEEADEY